MKFFDHKDFEPAPERTAYMREYYRKNKKRLLKKAHSRYKRKKKAIRKYYREKYQPKFRRNKPTKSS